MPQKLNVGLQQKVGQPNYGSAGAHCSVEFELTDAESFDSELVRQKTRQAFARCRAHVREELTRTTPDDSGGESIPVSPASTSQHVATWASIPRRRPVRGMAATFVQPRRPKSGRSARSRPSTGRISPVSSADGTRSKRPSSFCSGKRVS